MERFDSPLEQIALAIDSDDESMASERSELLLDAVFEEKRQAFGGTGRSSFRRKESPSTVRSTVYSSQNSPQTQRGQLALHDLRADSVEGDISRRSSVAEAASTTDSPTDLMRNAVLERRQLSAYSQGSKHNKRSPEEYCAAIRLQHWILRRQMKRAVAIEAKEGENLQESLALARRLQRLSISQARPRLFVLRDPFASVFLPYRVCTRFRARNRVAKDKAFKAWAIAADVIFAVASTEAMSTIFALGAVSQRTAKISNIEEAVDEKSESEGQGQQRQPSTSQRDLSISLEDICDPAKALPEVEYRSEEQGAPQRTGEVPLEGDKESSAEKPTIVQSCLTKQPTLTIKEIVKSSAARTAVALFLIVCGGDDEEKEEYQTSITERENESKANYSSLENITRGALSDGGEPSRQRQGEEVDQLLADPPSFLFLWGFRRVLKYKQLHRLLSFVTGSAPPIVSTALRSAPQTSFLTANECRLLLQSPWCHSLVARLYSLFFFGEIRGRPLLLRAFFRKWMRNARAQAEKKGQSISSIHGWLQSSKVEGEGEGSLSGAKSLLLAWFSYARVRAVKRAILMSIGDGKDAFKRIESTSGTAVFVPAQRREKGASFALPKSLSSPAANSRARGRCRALLFSIAEGSVFSEALRASGEQWRRARNAVSFSAYAFSGSTTASLASSAVSVYADSLRPQPVHLRPLITKWKSEVAATSKAVAMSPRALLRRLLVRWANTTISASRVRSFVVDLLKKRDRERLVYSMERWKDFFSIAQNFKALQTQIMRKWLSIALSRRPLREAKRHVQKRHLETVRTKFLVRWRHATQVSSALSLAGKVPLVESSLPVIYILTRWMSFSRAFVPSQRRVVDAAELKAEIELYESAFCNVFGDPLPGAPPHPQLSTFPTAPKLELSHLLTYPPYYCYLTARAFLRWKQVVSRMARFRMWIVQQARQEREEERELLTVFFQQWKQRRSVQKREAQPEKGNRKQQQQLDDCWHLSYNLQLNVPEEVKGSFTFGKAKETVVDSFFSSYSSSHSASSLGIFDDHCPSLDDSSASSALLSFAALSEGPSLLPLSSSKTLLLSSGVSTSSKGLRPLAREPLHFRYLSPFYPLLRGDFKGCDIWKMRRKVMKQLSDGLSEDEVEQTFQSQERSLAGVDSRRSDDVADLSPSSFLAFLEKIDEEQVASWKVEKAVALKDFLRFCESAFSLSRRQYDTRWRRDWIDKQVKRWWERRVVSSYFLCDNGRLLEKEIDELASLFEKEPTDVFASVAEEVKADGEGRSQKPFSSSNLRKEYKELVRHVSRWLWQNLNRKATIVLSSARALSAQRSALSSSFFQWQKAGASGDRSVLKRGAAVSILRESGLARWEDVDRAITSTAKGEALLFRLRELWYQRDQRLFLAYEVRQISASLHSVLPSFSVSGQHPTKEKKSRPSSSPVKRGARSPTRVAKETGGSMRERRGMELDFAFHPSQTKSIGATRSRRKSMSTILERVPGSSKKRDVKNLNAKTSSMSGRAESQKSTSRSRKETPTNIVDTSRSRTLKALQKESLRRGGYESSPSITVPQRAVSPSRPQQRMKETASTENVSKAMNGALTSHNMQDEVDRVMSRSPSPTHPSVLKAKQAAVVGLSFPEEGNFTDLTGTLESRKKQEDLRERLEKMREELKAKGGQRTGQNSARGEDKRENDVGQAEDEQDSAVVPSIALVDIKGNVFQGTTPRDRGGQLSSRRSQRKETDASKVDEQKAREEVSGTAGRISVGVYPTGLRKPIASAFDSSHTPMIDERLLQSSDVDFYSVDDEVPELGQTDGERFGFDRKSPIARPRLYFHASDRASIIERRGSGTPRSRRERTVSVASSAGRKAPEEALVDLSISTALLEAAETENEETVFSTLEACLLSAQKNKGKKLDDTSDTCMPLEEALSKALLRAVDRSTEGIVEKLLRAGADASYFDEYGWTSLHFGAQRGDVALLSLLLRWYKPSHEKTGASSRRSSIALSRRASRASSIAEEGETNKSSAEESQAVRGHEKSMLVNVSFAPSAIATTNKPETTSFVNKATTSGLTPLHVASSRGKAEAVLFLLEQGASPLLETSFGQRPFDLAKDEDTFRAFLQFLTQESEPRDIQNRSMKEETASMGHSSAVASEENSETADNSIRLFSSYKHPNEKDTALKTSTSAAFDRQEKTSNTEPSCTVIAIPGARREPSENDSLGSPPTEHDSSPHKSFEDRPEEVMAPVVGRETRTRSGSQLDGTGLAIAVEKEDKQSNGSASASFKFAEESDQEEGNRAKEQVSDKTSTERDTEPNDKGMSSPSVTSAIDQKASQRESESDFEGAVDADNSESVGKNLQTSKQTIGETNANDTSAKDPENSRKNAAGEVHRREDNPSVTQNASVFSTIEKNEASERQYKEVIVEVEPAEESWSDEEESESDEEEESEWTRQRRLLEAEVGEYAEEYRHQPAMMLVAENDAGEDGADQLKDNSTIDGLQNLDTIAEVSSERMSSNTAERTKEAEKKEDNNHKKQPQRWEIAEEKDRGGEEKEEKKGEDEDVEEDDEEEEEETTVGDLGLAALTRLAGNRSTIVEEDEGLDSLEFDVDDMRDEVIAQRIDRLREKEAEQEIERKRKEKQLKKELKEKRLKDREDRRKEMEGRELERIRSLKDVEDEEMEAIRQKKEKEKQCRLALEEQMRQALMEDENALENDEVAFDEMDEQQAALQGWVPEGSANATAEEDMSNADDVAETEKEPKKRRRKAASAPVNKTLAERRKKEQQMFVAASFRGVQRMRRTAPKSEEEIQEELRRQRQAQLDILMANAEKGFEVANQLHSMIPEFGGGDRRRVRGSSVPFRALSKEEKSEEVISRDDMTQQTQRRAQSAGSRMLRDRESLSRASAEERGAAGRLSAVDPKSSLPSLPETDESLCSDEELMEMFLKAQMDRKALNEGKGELRNLEREVAALEQTKARRRRLSLARQHMDNLNTAAKATSPRSAVSSKSPFAMIGDASQDPFERPTTVQSRSTAETKFSDQQQLERRWPETAAAEQTAPPQKMRTPRSYLRPPSAEAIASFGRANDSHAPPSPIYDSGVVLGGERRRKEAQNRDEVARREALAVAKAATRAWAGPAKGATGKDILGGVKAFLQSGQSVSKGGRPKPLPPPTFQPFVR